MSRAARLRKRFERRVRDSHRRWQLVSELRAGAFRRIDGYLMLRSSMHDLYIVTRDSPVRAEFIHPSWLAGLRR